MGTAALLDERTDARPPPAPRRNLPGWAVDLIRDGIGPQMLRGGGARAVRVALLRTANSAVQRGWTYAEWSWFVEGECVPSDLRTLNRASGEPCPSVLGHQLRHQRRKPLSTEQLRGQLVGIWDAAGEWVAENPPAAHDREYVAHLIDTARANLTASGLGDTDRTVMRTALNIAADLSTTRPALPIRTLAEASGLGTKAVRNALRRLARGGWLILDAPGRPAAPVQGQPGRASLYRLGPSALAGAAAS